MYPFTVEEIQAIGYLVEALNGVAKAGFNIDQTKLELWSDGGFTGATVRYDDPGQEWFVTFGPANGAVEVCDATE